VAAGIFTGVASSRSLKWVVYALPLGGEMTKRVRRRMVVAITVVVLVAAIGIAAGMGLFGQLAQDTVMVMLDWGERAYFWVLARQNHLALLVTVLGLFGGSYTAYKILINWNTVRRKLFQKYLEDEETGISKRKTPVSRHLQVANRRTSRFEAFDVNRWINDAISEFNRGNLDEARQMLERLNVKLEDRAQFAADQERIAKKQQASIHLFLGSIKAAQFKADDAIQEFQKTLKLMSNEDADAFKYMAEQKIAMSEREPENGIGGVHAQEGLDAAAGMKAIAQKSKDKRIEAEALLLEGRASLRRNGKVASKDRAEEGIARMEEVARSATKNDDGDAHRDDRLRGQLHELLGDAQTLLQAWNKADSAYTEAKVYFKKFNQVRFDIVERKRLAAVKHLTEEALKPWPHPNGELQTIH